MCVSGKNIHTHDIMVLGFHPNLSSCVLNPTMVAGTIECLPGQWLRNPAAVGGLIAFIGFEYIYVLTCFNHPFGGGFQFI